MNRTVERVLLAAVVLGLFVPGAVRLADPFETHEHSSSPSIDDSQPPAEMAYDAMMQTERHNYTVSLGIRWNDNWHPNATTAKVDTTHHRVTIDTYVNQYRTIFQNRHTEWMLYRNRTTRWSTMVGGGFSLWLRSGAFDNYHSTFWPKPVRRPQSNVTVISRNRTATVLRVNNNTTVSNIMSGPGDAGGPLEWDNITLYIDRDEQVLRRAVFRGSVTRGNQSTEEKIAYTFSDWGETTIDRPRGIPYTAEEIIDDILEKDTHHSVRRASASTAKTTQSRGIP